MKNLTRKWFPLTLAFLLVFTLSSCNEECPPCDDPKPVEAPEQIVEIDQAKMYYDNYSERRVPLIQRYEDSINRRKGYDKKQIQMQQDKSESESGEAALPKPFDVARYVHYDYKTIKQYLAYIEQEAEAANVEISTVRFYLSNYPDEAVFPGTKDSIKHPRQNSILISPTIKKGNRDYLFYIDKSAEGEEAVILGDDFGPAPKGIGQSSSKDGKSYASFAPSFLESNASVPVLYQNGTSLTMNRGGGAPPPYPGQ